MPRMSLESYAWISCFSPPSARLRVQSRNRRCPRSSSYDPHCSGVCNNRFGTIGTWATDVLNLVAGRLGEVGGAMFTTPAIGISGLSPYLGDGYGRWRSRVRGLPETFGDLPASALAEEIETKGAGQWHIVFSSVLRPRKLGASLSGSTTS